MFRVNRHSWLAVLFLFSLALLAKEFMPPKVFHAKTYPARDEHPDEQVTIAADPYDMPDKASIFNVNYKDEDFLPVRLIVSNDGNDPVQLVDVKVELITANRSKIPPATVDDLYRRIGHLKHKGNEPKRIPLPLPKQKASSMSKDTAREIEQSQFQAKAVEPHGTQAGFLYFDVEGVDNPLAGAHIYVTGVRNGKGTELMFFDIPMEKYLSYRPGVSK